MCDVVVVGAGLFGLTVAERLATAGWHVRVIERRNHVGGNAWSTVDPDTGIEVHPYGAHIFHTSNETVWAYVNRFTEFTDYRHRVWSLRSGQLHPLPFTLATLSSVLGQYVTPGEAVRLLKRVPSEHPTSMEDKALSLIGATLYDALVRDYTHKQWQTPPSELPPDLITRLPFSLTYSTDYFTDTHQGMPRDGYAAWLTRMATHPRIEVRLNESWTPTQSTGVPVVYSGPLDEFFGYDEGALSWRTIDLHMETLPVRDAQGTAVINYADLSEPATRSIEFRHFHPEREQSATHTVVAREFSRWAKAGDEPYYPVASPPDRDLARRYKARATADWPRVTFGGRLGSYTYLDMHAAIGAGLAVSRRMVNS